MCESGQDEWDACTAALARLRERPRDLSPSVIGQELIRLRRLGDALDLEFARTAAQFAATNQYEVDGYASPVHWMRHNCHLASGVAGSAVAVGEQAGRLSESIEAVEDGRIGFAHLALMARVGEDLDGSSPARAFDERPLLRAALDHTVTRFRQDCAHARHAADAQAFLREHVDLVEARWLEVRSRDDGCVFIRGFLDSVGGAAVRTALEPLAGRDGPNDPRSQERRFADALVELADHALRADVLPARGGRVPQLLVTAGVETLLNLKGAAAGELEFAGPIPAATVQRLACEAGITRVVFDSQSAVIDVGRSRRVPGSSQRRALHARDKGCVWPGCERPAAWTAAHHVVHWVHGGATETQNLVLLCGRHHWKVHEGGWQIVRNDDGRILTIPPIAGYAQQARAPTAGAA